MKKILFLLLLIPVLSFGQSVYTYSNKAVTYGGDVVIEAASTYCAEYQAVYDAFTTKPASDSSAFWNTMVSDIGTYWDSLDVFYFYAVHTNGDGEALINWTNPGTYDATAYNAPTFTAYEGFTGNGTTQYINCNWNPSANGVNYTQNSASAGVYVRTNTGVNGAQAGNYDATSYLTINSRNASDQAGGNINNAGSGLVAANTDGRGFYIVSRTASNERQFYKNGSLIGDDTEASNGVMNNNVYVLGYNNNGIPAIVKQDQLSCFFAGAGLSITAITTITNAIETCMDAAGKGVIAQIDPLDQFNDLMLLQYLAFQLRINEL